MPPAGFEPTIPSGERLKPRGHWRPEFEIYGTINLPAWYYYIIIIIIVIIIIVIIIIIIIIIISSSSSSSSSSGARGGLVVKALRYKPAGRGFYSRCCHWNFSAT